MIYATINNKIIGRGNRTKKVAIELIGDIKWPSVYYAEVHTKTLRKPMNDDTNLGETSRIRMAQPMNTEKCANRMREQNAIAKDTGLNWKKNPDYNYCLPTELTGGRKKKQRNFRRTARVPPSGPLGNMGDSGTRKRCHNLHGRIATRNKTRRTHWKRS